MENTPGRDRRINRRKPCLGKMKNTRKKLKYGQKCCSVYPHLYILCVSMCARECVWCACASVRAGVCACSIFYISIRILWRHRDLSSASVEITIVKYQIEFVYFNLGNINKGIQNNLKVYKYNVFNINDLISRRCG